MKTFGELTEQEQNELFQHWLKHKNLELRDSRGYWFTKDEPLWHWSNCYRIPPTKPSINWDHVAEGYDYLFNSGHSFYLIVPDRPIFTGAWGWDRALIQLPAEGFSSFKPGTCDWKDSLVVRPGVEE